MRINKEIFFDKFRDFYKSKTGKKSLSISTANAVDYILDKFSASDNWNDKRHIAYALATIAHETAWTFQPIKEYRAKAGTKSRRVQDKYWGTGFYGRGFVQLTHDYNYLKASKELGIDLVSNPDSVLRPDIAFKILDKGMHEGWFTTKKLSDYINSKVTDYVGARKIINGIDKKDLIAGYAVDFAKMLVEKKEDDVYVAPEEEIDVAEDVNTAPVGVEEDEDVDSEEESPKAGEAAPESTAKEGEPVVGGRPNDEPKLIASSVPIPTSGPGTWVASIRAQMGAAGVSIASIITLATGLVAKPEYVTIVLWVLVAAIIGGAVILVVSIIIKAIDKRAREREANMITLKELEIQSMPDRYNVKVIRQG